MKRHPLPSFWTEGPISVYLVGAGGTGSQVLTGLARLHIALLALGRPGGLDVTVWDPDRVSPSNIGRQLFSAGDIGASKASVLVHRVNSFFGLNWKAKPECFEGQGQFPALVITCVDTAAARREIFARGCDRCGMYSYWLDCGNSQQSGQVFLSQFPPFKSEPWERAEKRLPTLARLLPEIFDDAVPEDNRPSCSLAEALESQDLFINQAIATQALHLLWSFVREGGLDICGYWINLAEGRVVPVPIPDPAPVAEFATAPAKGRRKVGRRG